MNTIDIAKERRVKARKTLVKVSRRPKVVGRRDASLKTKPSSVTGEIKEDEDNKPEQKKGESPYKRTYRTTR